MVSVSREELVQGLTELLPSLVGSRPPELAQRRVDAGSAKYVAALRHGQKPTGVYLMARKGTRVTALVAVSPSPFDTTIFGLPVGRVQTLEVVDVAEAPSVVRATERTARHLGFELLFARVSPSSPTVPALIERGFQIYGATVLYSGKPTTIEGASDGVYQVLERSEVAEAARVARLGFTDTHLSRDHRLDRRKGRALYESWVKAEAERGAQILMIRHNGRATAVAVIRENPLAREHLGIEQWHLHLLAVHPSAQGSGQGRRIANAACARAIGAGADIVQTGVDTGSLAAQRIYTGLGLLPSGSSIVLHKWL